MSALHTAMVVDDDRDDLELARRVLVRTKRFDVVLTASDGVEAVEAFRRYAAGRPVDEGFPPLLLLLDINMPQVDGFAVLEAMSELDGAVLPQVVVMLSSSHAAADRERAASFDIVSDYIVKPLTRAATHQLADRAFAV